MVEEIRLGLTAWNRINFRHVLWSRPEFNLQNSFTRFSTLVFRSKSSTWALLDQENTVSRNYLFSRRYSRKMYVRTVVYYVETRISNFVNEYLRKNEKVHETVVAGSYGV